MRTLPMPVHGGAGGGMEADCAQGDDRSWAAEVWSRGGYLSAVAAIVCALDCDRDGLVLSRQRSAGVSLAASLSIKRHAGMFDVVRGASLRRCGTAALLSEQILQRQAKIDTPQAFHGGMRLMGVDSFVVDVPDTPTHSRAFGRPKWSLARSLSADTRAPSVRAGNASVVEVAPHTDRRTSLRSLCVRRRSPATPIRVDASAVCSGHSGKLPVCPPNCQWLAAGGYGSFVRTLNAAC